MDLTFQTPQGKFNFRVGAIILHRGNILMVKNERASYYYSVGGRVKFGETCDEAIVREVREELGIDMEIDYMAFFQENHFDDDDTLQHFHEISVFYVMKPLDDYRLIDCHSYVEESGLSEQLEWIPIAQFAEKKAYPTFFASELDKLDGTLRYIVQIQDRTI